MAAKWFHFTNCFNEECRSCIGEKGDKYYLLIDKKDKNSGEWVNYKIHEMDFNKDIYYNYGGALKSSTLSYAIGFMDDHEYNVGFLQEISQLPFLREKSMLEREEFAQRNYEKRVVKF